MDKIGSIGAGIVAATLGPSLLVSALLACQPIYSESSIPFNLAFVTIMVAAFLYTLFLGIPIALLLLRNRAFNLPTMIGSGFAVGCLPFAAWCWPMDQRPGSSYSYWRDNELVVAKIDGAPTLIGWTDYAQAVGSTGTLGAVGGI